MTPTNNAAQAAEQEAVRRALELYAECYDTMIRIAQREGREPVVSPVSVAVDIRKNMVNAVVKALSKLRAEGVPGASEWTAFDKWHLSDFGRRPVPFRASDTHRWEGWQARADLTAGAAPVASAPADERAAGINPDKCDTEVYERGTSVGLCAISKEDANTICAGIAAATGARVDWHYSAGRVHIKALPAQASAPVAEEVVAWAAVPSRGKRAGRIYSTCDTRKEIDAYIDLVHQSNDSLTLTPRPLSFADAAPQASTEPARILFPAHLRKMWSGGEVQAWPDEHQDVTPPPATSKCSLERYRQWKADQAAPVCSCPSGDGSLHPCAAHPAPPHNAQPSKDGDANG